MQKVNKTSAFKNAFSFEMGHCGFNYIDSQRKGRYNLNNASGDLINNSLDAEADKIWVVTEGPSKNINKIIFIDNGVGMDDETLKGSYTLGFQRQRTLNQNGKFGVGGTLGCLGIAGNKITVTRNKSGVTIARQYDIKDIEKNDAWGHTKIDPPQWIVDTLDKYVGRDHTGTIIVLSNCSIVTGKQSTEVGQF